MVREALLTSVACTAPPLKCQMSQVSMVPNSNSPRSAWARALGTLSKGQWWHLALAEEYSSSSVLKRFAALAKELGVVLPLSWFEKAGNAYFNSLAVADADVVTTDTWVSMGMEAEKEQRVKTFTGYTVHQGLMEMAKPSAIFLHCLPAHRGEEVTDDVIDGAQSVVFDEAENRLHAQKSILAWCLGAI